MKDYMSTVIVNSKELKEHYQHLENKEEVIVSCRSCGSACLNLVSLKMLKCIQEEIKEMKLRKI